MRAISLVRRVMLAAAAALLAGSVLAGGNPAGPAQLTASTTTSVDFLHACTATVRPGQAACAALVRIDVAQRSQADLGPRQAPTGSGYGPSELQSAYLLPSDSAGAGRTVAIVDAYDYPTAESDLATYRSDWGLPPCTTANGCFRKVNQDGAASPLPTPSGSSGWATEEALDIEMVSATCPNCHILLVEAASPQVDDLGVAVNTAVALGARFVSNSYDAPEFPDETAADAAYYDHPGVAVTASTGDNGYGVYFPASSQHVVAVGGTSLSTAANDRGWSETAWSGAGSGCSASQPKPSWQTDPGCGQRTNADVSAVADPATGVAVYDTYDRAGWLEVGGTSVSSPIIASVYALVGSPAAGTYPASYLYARPSALNDVVDGSNGTCSPDYLCTGVAGYDGPTGLGTPHGVEAFGLPAGNLVTVGNPGDQTATQDLPFRLQVHAVDTAAGAALTYSSTGLPPGLSIAAGSGLISGTPTTVGRYPVGVTASDSTGASGTARFVITVASPVGFTGPGPQTGYVGQPVTVEIAASDALAGRTLQFAASALPAGLSLNAATGVISGVPARQGYVHATVTATDSAGRTADDSFIWYLAPAQVGGRTGPIALASTGACLDGSRLALARCSGASAQAWTITSDGTLRTLGQCLSAGSAVQLAACSVDAAQQWRVVSFGGLRNPASGSCLAAVGTRLAAQSCTGGTAQRWVLPAGPVVSALTGLCADGGASTTGHVQVWYCAGTAAQGWSVQPDGTLRVGKSCLDSTGGDVATLAKCTGSAAQQWRVHADGTVVDPASGDCLADAAGSLIAGSRLVFATCDASAAQMWHVE